MQLGNDSDTMYSCWMHYIYCQYWTYVFMHSCTYILTYLHSWLGAYKTGNISETDEDRAKVNGLYKVVHIHMLSIADE